jgi:glyoxylase-like metal-dependent hydrolase (beta-lactamase superfamily II)
LKPVAAFAFNPGPITGEGNWTWLLPGGLPTLIDAGTGDARHLEAVDRALGGATLAQVLVTHGHGDHASGAPALRDRFAVDTFRKLPWPLRDEKWPVRWSPLRDGDVIDAGGTQLTALHTPGHAPDHLCFWHEESRSLFGGDLAIKGTTVWIPASLDGNLAEYLASLERVLALRPARIFPAHGPVIEEPDKVLRSYLDHRRERERQVIDALRAGARTPDAIVAHVYRGLKESLVPLARESVIAHLQKLAHDNRAVMHENAWTMIDP